MVDHLQPEQLRGKEGGSRCNVTEPIGFEDTTWRDTTRACSSATCCFLDKLCDGRVKRRKKSRTWSSIEGSNSYTIKDYTCTVCALFYSRCLDSPLNGRLLLRPCHAQPDFKTAGKGDKLAYPTRYYISRKGKRPRKHLDFFERIGKIKCWQMLSSIDISWGRDSWKYKSSTKLTRRTK